MQEEDFKIWLRPVDKDPCKAYCSSCNATMVAELTSIKRHSQGYKHINKLINTASTSGTQPTLNTFFSKDSRFDNEVKELEISLCSFFVEHNISYRAMDHLSNLLKSKITDSKLVKNINIARTKTRGIITNVIGATHKEELAKKIKNTKFSILSDESTDIAAIKQMCIVVRFFDGKNIASYFWELVAIESSTAESIFDGIMKTFLNRNIPASNIIGFGSDGCNVMMGKNNSVATRFMEMCPGIKIVKCICHSLHICSSEACKVLPRSIEDLARDIYSFFKVYKPYYLPITLF